MKKNKYNIWDFFPMTKGYRLRFVVAFLSIILAVLISYITPQVIRVTVDSVIGNEPFDVPNFIGEIIEDFGGRDFLAQNLYICAIVSFALALTASLCDFGARSNLAKACEGSLEKIRNMLFGHIQRLPYKWHSVNQTGDIIQRCTSDVEIIKTFVSDQFQSMFRTVFSIFIALSLMFPMNVKLSLIALIFIPITLIYSWVFYIMIGKKFKAADECEGELSSIAQENLTAVRVVRAFGREKYEIDKFGNKNKEFADLWVKLGLVMGFNWGIGDLIGLSQIVIIIVMGTIEAVNGNITTGEFILFIAYNSMLVWPIRHLGRILSELSKTSISATRLFDILTAEEEKDCENPKTADMTGDIEFKNVNFTYSDKLANALHDINFKIEGGKTLGILGATGSGKTTLMYLLDRLYDLPRENGSITIGGVDVRDMSLDFLRKNIGIVLQEPFLFSKTFVQSIADSADHCDLDKVREYARIAVIDDTIQNFSLGYETQIGERGVTISGGQKQRVAIARMLMQNSPIKIFDDSLSAVDMETDAKIRDSINNRVKGTTIIIAHRISTIKNSDLIIVMDKGRIVQKGNHKELSEQEGVYKRIFDSQKSKEND